VTLDPAFASRLDLWVARELTIVGLWAQSLANQVPNP
jgi:hypothetical protein